MTSENDNSAQTLGVSYERSLACSSTLRCSLTFTEYFLPWIACWRNQMCALRI